MRLGEKILKIRKDNKLTQENFAEKYNVTRQTISSWENSKSFPDLDTLVKISDDFNISLDVLLKEDKKMIESISKDQKDSKKYKKITLTVVGLIGIIIVCLGIFALKNNQINAQLEKQFNATIQENNFYKNTSGGYSFDLNKKITYTISKQTPQGLFNFSSNPRCLYCSIKLNDKKHLVITWADYNSYEATLFNSKTNNEIQSTGFLSSKNCNPILVIKKMVNVDTKLLEKAVDKGNSLYNEFVRIK